MSQTATRILIADDDAEVRRVLARILRGAGYEVETVPNGAMAVELHRTNPAQLALLDMYMPDTDGLEAMVRLRQEFPALRVVAISGGGQLKKEEVLEMASRLGADRVLAKPVDEKTLLQTVREVLGA